MTFWQVRHPSNPALIQHYVEMQSQNLGNFGLSGSIVMTLLGKGRVSLFSCCHQRDTKLGEGVASPRGHKIDGPYLDANEQDIKQYVAQFKDDWGIYGVSIMCDSWSGPTQLSIINFMLYYNGSLFFHKPVNATCEMQNANFLYREIRKVVEEVGVRHIIQIVTDNGANYT